MLRYADLSEPLHFTIPADHPSLPGHFPGSPLVPGVVVLSHVLQLLAEANAPALTLSWVKFLRPLLPEQRADVSVTESAGEIRFSVSHAGSLLVRGSLNKAGRVQDT